MNEHVSTDNKDEEGYFWKKLSYFDNDDSFIPWMGSSTELLKSKDQEYRLLRNKVSEIMDNYPNVGKIIDDIGEVKQLNGIEIAKLKEILSLYFQIDYIEKKDIFFQGMREQYFLFNRMNLIKSGTDLERE